MIRTVLLALDISATFDAVDHSVLGARVNTNLPSAVPSVDGQSSSSQTGCSTSRQVRRGSGVGVRLKVGDKMRVGSGEGLCPPQLGVWGLPQKKNLFCAKNYAILSKFWYFFPILQHKNFQHAKIERESGGLSPSPKSRGLSPCPPCSDAYAERSETMRLASGVPLALFWALCSLRCTCLRQGRRLTVLAFNIISTRTT